MLLGEFSIRNAGGLLDQHTWDLQKTSFGYQDLQDFLIVEHLETWIRRHPSFCWRPVQNHRDNQDGRIISSGTWRDSGDVTMMITHSFTRRRHTKAAALPAGSTVPGFRPRSDIRRSSLSLAHCFQFIIMTNYLSPERAASTTWPVYGHKRNFQQ